MSINVVDEFIKFKTKTISKNLSDIMGERYDKDKCNNILNKYFEIRYFNENYKLNGTHSKEEVYKLINEYILRTLTDEYDKNIVTLIYLLDGNFESVEEKIFKKIVEKNERFFNYFIEELDCKDFILDLQDTNIATVYDVGLNYNIEFPDLYSQKAIDNVFNTGTIAEKKLLIEYILVLRMLLTSAISFEFDNEFMVDFNINVLENKNKLDKVLKLLNNKLALDHISFKITYEDFLKYKDDISELINKGYQFSVILNDDVILTREAKIYLKLFKYIIVKKDSVLMLSEFDNVVKKEV